ncbi:MAG TPA: Rne/Rng family ribonuclease [Nitrospiria bacterium]|nr:Rne/Rng family ribonuclease [Nitrospiria bacterium]
MGIEIVIDPSREETRVAVLEQQVLTELFIDRKRDRGMVGNVYKGRVVKVLPGMQAAFVDIGVERAAFLYVADIVTESGGPPPAVDSADSPENGDEAETGSDAAKGNDAGEGEGEDEEATVKASPRPRRVLRSIEDLIREGQEVVVQVTKDPIGTKGCRVTTYLSFPGRYLVFMPTVNHIGISRRIGDDGERARLREMMSRLRQPGAGYIIRTVSEGTSEDEFRMDIEFLGRLWQTIRDESQRKSAPALLHADLDLSLRTVRDLLTNKVDRLTVGGRAEYDRIRQFVSTYLPTLVSKIHLYAQDEPIFDRYGIEIEISKALGRRVWLKSGGYIVIEHTEALTVIDVNTGRYVGKRDLEETILKTNLEAAKEIAYQLRLRNIGGIIIIDFIDMEKEKNRERVFSALRDALATDRARSNILRISELGLVEMSRERVREDLLRILCDSCLYCERRGYVRSATTVCYEIFREIRRAGSARDAGSILVTVHPNVANLLFDEERDGVEALEREFNKRITIKADPHLHQEQYDLVLV